MRTIDEIKDHIARITEKDMFGFMTADLVAYLPYAEAKRYLRQEATEEDWKPRSPAREAVIDVIKDYMPFAWDKANNCRGLSAGRSIAHMMIWLWMLEEDEASKAIEHYNMYGKVQLREVCDHFKIDWRQWDNNKWTDDESEPGMPADEVLPLTLQWRVL